MGQAQKRTTVSLNEGAFIISLSLSTFEESALFFSNIAYEWTDSQTEMVWSHMQPNVVGQAQKRTTVSLNEGAFIISLSLSTFEETDDIINFSWRDLTKVPFNDFFLALPDIVLFYPSKGHRAI